jgi:DNA-binding LytR/AlgR family response regulator
MSPLKILLVEDELIIAEMIKEMLEDMGHTMVGIVSNSAVLDDFLNRNKQPDLVILDINLQADLDGITIAEKWLMPNGIPHIYLTSYSDASTVRRAAITNPEGYLLKPFSAEDLFATIELVRARKQISGKSMVLKDGRDVIKLDTSKVLFVKSDNNYLEIVTDKKHHLVRMTLDAFLQTANDANFIRTHRSYAVNIQKLDAIKGSSLLLGKYSCPISRSYKDDLLGSLKKFG